MLSLVVEDDPTSRKILEAILSEYGEVHCAVTGMEGYEMFAQMRLKNTPYDLVCLDILLPGMSGQEVLRGIRSMEEADVVKIQVSKVVMITAMDDRENVIHAFREQCDAYLVKPVQARDLREQIDGLGFVRDPEHAKKHHS